MKAPDTVQLRLVHPIQKRLEFGLGFSGIANDKRTTQGNVGANAAPFRDPVQGALRRRRTRHAFERVRVRVLEWHVQIGQDQAVRHQRDQLAHMRVGIDIMQAHPRPEAAKVTRQSCDMLFRAPLCILPIDPIGAGVLADHQKLLHTCLDKLFGLTQHRLVGPRLQLAAHIRDDAEFALVIAAFRNLQIAEMARG